MCEECDGTGDCPQCHGDVVLVDDCEMCLGSGTCIACDGSGEQE